MRWLGNVYGYIPDEEDLKAQMDVFIEDYHDAYAKFQPPIFETDP
jgi:hypothetical protein